VPRLTPEQVAHAQLTKKGYLISVLVMAVLNGIYVLVGTPGHGLPRTAFGAVYVSATGAFLVMTWRICRAIQMSRAATVLATVLAPFTFLFEVAVLLRIYSRRTGPGPALRIDDKVAHQPVQP